MFHTADEFWMFGGSDGVGMVCRGGWLVVVKIETLSELQKSLLDNLGGMGDNFNEKYESVKISQHLLSENGKSHRNTEHENCILFIIQKLKYSIYRYNSTKYFAK